MGAARFRVSLQAILLLSLLLAPLHGSLAGCYLLYKDYQTDQKFVVTTYTANDAITASCTRKDELVLGEITMVKRNNVGVLIKTDSESNFLTTFTLDEFAAPGLRTTFSFIVPDKRSGKLELQYLHDRAGISASIGLAANPVLNVSSVVGTNAVAIGADVSFDYATGQFTKYNTGLNIVNLDLIASLTLNDKGDSVSASYYHLVNPRTSTAVGAELTRTFSTNKNTLTFGMQHALNPLTMFKARFDNYGKASTAIQQEWRPKSFITVSGEVAMKAFEKSPKVGLCLLLVP